MQDHNQFAQETERKKLSEAEFLEQFKLLSAKTQQNLWKKFENSRAAQGFGSEDWQEATKGNQLKKRKMLRGWIMDKQSTGKFFKEARTYVVKRNLL